MNYIYIICPVGTDPDFGAKRALLESIAANHGLRPFFPLEHRSGVSTSQLIADICNSAFVVADMSLERPSCYFELGLARAVRVPIVVLARSGTRIHQVGDQPVNFYGDLQEYRQIVERTCGSCVEE